MTDKPNEPNKGRQRMYTVPIGAIAMAQLRELVELEDIEVVKTLRAQAEFAIMDRLARARQSVRKRAQNTS